MSSLYVITNKDIEYKSGKVEQPWVGGVLSDTMDSHMEIMEGPGPVIVPSSPLYKTQYSSWRVSDQKLK